MRRRTVLGLVTAGSLRAASAVCPTLGALLFARPGWGKTTKGVDVTPDAAKRRVDITIDGQPFTSYIWPETLKKPVLYPIVDGDGVTVTRGWPLEPRAGERTDHPHHDGLWFNYSNVNGFDFWNNSTAIPAARAPKMGTIVFDKIVSTKSGAQSRRVGEQFHVDRRAEPRDPRGDHALCVCSPGRDAHD